MGDGNGGGEALELDEEEDEETLQLKLQEIQAKLRLKKLQAAKAQKSAAATPSRSTPRLAQRAEGSGLTYHNPRSPQRSAVEVPASPVRQAKLAAEAAVQKSPKRVLLGIDKGLRGQDVSLKRPPPSFQRGLAGDGGRSSALRGATGSSQKEQSAPRPLSFNERLAAARTQEAARQDQSERIQRLRTAAFSVGKDEMDQYKSKAVDIPVTDDGVQKYSRDDILGAASGRRPLSTIESGGGSSGTALRRSNTTPNIRSKYAEEEETPTTASHGTVTGDAESTDSGSFEPYSSFHLSKRILPHSVVARSVSGKTTFSIQDLLRQVKAPNFELPEVETDVVVLGIVAEKSDPRAHKPVGDIGDAGGAPMQQKDRGKYMVLTLVDLTYQIELFLFKSGFERFWKMSTGTVVAILNPGIMPPPPGRKDTGRWSLVINSDEDTILEIGTARDLGYCKTVKRDGHQCSAWVNAKRTEYCEFHMNEATKKMRATRNELNGATGFGSAGNGGKGARGGRGGGRGGRPGERNNTGYDRFLQSHWFVASQGASASSLIDNELLNGGYADKVERQEGIKRRLAAKERESDIARKLASIGTGAGRDYMKIASREPQQLSSASSSSRKKVPKAAADLASGSLSASSVASSTTMQTSHSTVTAASSMTTVGSAAEQAAASRASLLASIAARRGAGLSAKHVAALGEDRAGSESTSATPTPAVLLGPAKRKRPQSSMSATTGGASRTAEGHASSVSALATAAGHTDGGYGWGSALQAKLGRMKDGEKLAAGRNQTIEHGFSRAAAAAAAVSLSSAAAPDHRPPSAAPEHSPVRKKTRFLLGGKGIREAGRESLGTTGLGVGAGGSAADEDDDDELIII